MIIWHAFIQKAIITMVSGDHKTLWSTISPKLRNSKRKLRFLQCYMFRLIPGRRLESILKRAEKTPFIRK
jgi:hypothetical protein